jgi:hypothetical protein
MAHFTPRDKGPLHRNSPAPGLRNDCQVPSNTLLEVRMTPAGVIKAVYPPGQSALGHDILRDPERSATALETIATGALTIAGPLRLFNGQLGLEARYPIFFYNQTANEVRMLVWSLGEHSCAQLWRAVSA